MLYTKNHAYILMAVTLVLFVCWFHVLNGRDDDNGKH
jgi:hypothetical protein